MRAIGKAEEDDEHEAEAAAEAISYEPLHDVIAPDLRTVAKDGADEGLRQLGLDDLLSQADPRAVEWADERAAALITQVSDTTKERIRGLVATAEEEGWSNDKLADEIVADHAFSTERAELIARTETAMADVAGNVIGWQESGVVTGKEWKTGEGCCDECEALDGTVVGIDDEFEEGDPPLHPQCRCDLLPVLDEPEQG